jgi:hypothetical protein
LADAERLLDSLPDGSIFLTDQLVSSTAPALMARQRDRLVIVPIVHHALALEGRTADPALAQSEELSLACASLVICTSGVTAAMLRQEYRMPASKLVVAVPGCDHAPITRGSGGDGPSLLSLGAVVPRKGSRAAGGGSGDARRPPLAAHDRGQSHAGPGLHAFPARSDRTSRPERSHRACG